MFSHTYNSPVPDRTGTLTVWDGATTASVAASNLIKPSHWNADHGFDIELGGNTANSSRVTGAGQLVIAGGPNVTLSGDANTLVISAAAGGAADGFNRLAAGTQTAGTLQTIVFANSNGISFGMSGSSQITASYTVPQLSVGNSNLGNTQGDTGVVTGRLVFVGSNNITLSGSTNGGSMTISISGGAGAAGNTGSISAGTTRGTLGEVVFSNSNGVSFGIDGQTLTASIATSLTNIRVSAGTTSNLLSAITFANSNGISFGLDASTVTASHNGLTSQSNQNVTAANGGFAFQTLSFSNANGFSFGTSAGSAITGSYTVPTQTNQTAGIYAVGNTTGQSSSSTYDARTLSLDGAGGISVGWSNSTVRISGPVSATTISGVTSGNVIGTRGTRFALEDHQHEGVYAAGVSNLGNIAGDTGVRPGRMVLIGGNNVTLSGATAAGSLQSITISAANQTVDTAGIYALGHTTGQSSSSTHDLRTLSVEGAGFISVGWSNGSLRISGTQTNPVVSNAIQSVGSATGSGTNTSRFAADDHVHAGVFSVGVSNLGNTVGDTRVDVGRFVLQGGNNVTLSQITAANALNTIIISGAAGGGAGYSAGLSNIGNTSGDTGVVTGRLVLAGGNNITLSGSTNGGSMTITVSAPNLGAGAMSAGVSNLGNTAGATGITGTQMVLVGSGVISLSQTTGANGGTVSINAPATSSLSATGAVSISTNGSTISIGVPAPRTNSGFHPYADLPMITGQIGQGTLRIEPQRMPNVQFDRAVIALHNSNSSNSSGSHTLSFWLGIYTRNASTLSLLASTSSSTAITHSGTAGSYSLYSSGPRLFTIPWTQTLTEADYWFGFVSRTTSGGANGSYSNWVVSNVASNFMGHFGSSHNTTYQLTLGQGVYTATTSAMPGSVGFTQIRGSDSQALRAPLLMFASGTV